MHVRRMVVQPGGAAATAANVVEHATLFRFGFAADLVGIACLLRIGVKKGVRGGLVPVTA
jgi:hypothetical protein